MRKTEEKSEPEPTGDYGRMLGKIAWRLHLCIGGPEFSESELQIIYERLDAMLPFASPE